jgi:hypothetical protein
LKVLPRSDAGKLARDRLVAIYQRITGRSG